MEATEFVDDFFLRSGNTYPTLMELPYAEHEIQWERSEGEKMYVHGKCNGMEELSMEIDLWKLELPLEGKPKFLVRQVTGSWMELRKPREFYLETMKVVLVGAYFLIFAKQSPNSSKGDVWRYVRKECRNFKVKPNHTDLIQSFLLLQSMVRADPVLQESPIIPQFFPSLSKNMKRQIDQGSDLTGKRLPVKRGSLPAAEALTPESPDIAKKEDFSIVEATPPPGGNPKGDSSLLSTPRTRSLTEFATPDDVPLTLDEQISKKRKQGRTSFTASRKKRNKSGRDSVVEDDEWVDEPDVCAFCDDGVESGQKLLCCDGPCMRSFHPTIDSGRHIQCPTLCLSKRAVSAKSWICPNCEAKQHQCFACGKLGSSATSDFQQVFVCGAKQCRRFYHPDCAAKLLVPDSARHIVASSIQLKLDIFICPLHKCASCQLDEDKTDPDLCIIKCRRCPMAWHKKCLPDVCRSQSWPLEGGKYVMYCGQHRLDPELQTPNRDHITFPGSAYQVNGTYRTLLLQSLEMRKPSSASPDTRHHKLNAYQKVQDIISKSCKLVTLESVKQKLRHP